MGKKMSGLSRASGLKNYRSPRAYYRKARRDDDWSSEQDKVKGDEVSDLENENEEEKETLLVVADDDEETEREQELESQNPNDYDRQILAKDDDGMDVDEDLDTEYA